MNIGFLYGLQIHKPGTGGSVHGYQLAKNLTDCGHRLYTWYWSDPESRLLTHFRGRQAFAFLSAIDALYIRLEWGGRSAQYPLLRYLSQKRIPVIWEINGLPEEKMFHGSSKEDINQIKRRLRRYAKHVDAAVCVSDGIAQFAKDTLGIETTMVIPNGSDPVLFKPIEKSTSVDSPLVVAWIGTTKAGWHDLEVMVDAARILEKLQEDILFWIFGDPSKLPENLPSNIVCKGLYPYEQLAAELPRADVGLHLYRPEISAVLDGSPLKQFDYMSSGLALVAQPDGQRRLLLEEWRAGTPVGEGGSGLAATLSCLAKDRSRVKMLGDNGRRAVEEHFNWRRAAAQTDELLTQLTACKP